MARRRNPSRRSRLDPGTEGELGARQESIQYYAKDSATQLLKGEPMLSVILEGRQMEMSWVQIRKALHKTVNILIKQVKSKAR